MPTTKDTIDQCKDTDISKVINNIIANVNESVIPLSLHGHKDLSIIMASFTALLDEIFIYNNPNEPQMAEAIAAGMRKLTKMVASPKNEKVEIIDILDKY